MSKKGNVFYPPLFSDADYYSKKDGFRFPVTTIEKSVSKPTVLKNYNGITFFYFRNNAGKIIVNSIEYPVQRGTLMLLGAYHYFQIVPDEGRTIEVVKCRLSYDAFLYMAANPYYCFSEITLARIPLSSTLEGSMLERTESLLDRLIRATIRHNKKGGETEFLLCMRLLGILQHTHVDKNRK